MVNAYFTPAKIKTTANETFHTSQGDITTRQLVKAFKIRGVPATYFLKPDGSVIFSVPGYLPPENYGLVLRYIGEGHYLEKSFDDFRKENSNKS